MKRLTTPALAAAVLAAGPALAEDVSYDYEGTALTGYFAKAENPQGLVIIAHDWDGLDDFERGQADELAEMGYDAFALSMYADDTPLEGMEDYRAATQEVTSDRTRMQGLIEAGVTQARDLSDAEQMIVMGYCFGGGVALEMARSDMADMAAGYATFHGTLATPEGESYDGEEPPILILHGGADQAVPMSDVVALSEELEAAGNTYTIEVYSGAPHAFSVEGSDSYQERAATESWQAFTDFAAERFGS
ncbi:dienelactone hydrolase family protein [Pseudoroseicyclus aestuarii]|uniref:Dienelactone hydrolase n=1 Tax=Pseudoroseicyclus aestuarii TaxID=1795041 RepID=A0A318SU52_9RHOB|nr:dienelactone hydrolase family protein [Pseudoroseicyclus aestuarii]PYE83899.1 dienelactone hydrolase [Pseudoroseicyclus aestuarii]